MIPVSKRVVRLGWLFAGAVLVLICLSSVWTAVTTVLDAPHLTGSEVAPATPPPAPTAHPRETFVALSGSPIFQGLSTEPAPTAVAAPEPTELEGLDETPLKLRLVGTVVRPAGESLAIIENEASRTQKTYLPGDVVVPGATLQEVHDQVVVIVHNGRREKLTMLEGAETVALGATSGTRVASGARSFASAQQTPMLGERASQPQPAIRRINANLRVLNREAFVQEYGADAMRTIGTVSAEPRLVEGQPAGLVLNDLGRGDLLGSLGFAPQDVVVSVNSQRVNSIQDFEALEQLLSDASDVRVQIIRENLPRTLIYKIR